MSFAVEAHHYARFMGRYSSPLARAFVGLLDVRAGQRALDVGAGTGVLAEVLVQRLGSRDVAAIEPSQALAAELLSRLPDVDVRIGRAEELPFADGAFDLVLAQLVVHFMADPVRGLAEMRRVASADGVVAATVWDHGSDAGPLSTFWRSARDLDPGVRDESELAGSRAGDLVRLFAEAGMPDGQETSLTVAVQHPDFDDWWEPYLLGVGAVGDYVGSLPPEQIVALRELCRSRLPSGPFETAGTAWTVVWRDAAV